VTLTALDLRPEYTKGRDDIAAEFYLPCMERSQRYDRVSGYFSSSIFALAWPALRSFVARDGSIRLICSPSMSAADVAALQRAADAEADGALASALLADLRGMLASPELRDPTIVLAALVARGTLTIRVAILGDGVPAAERRIFHDKVGLFFDDAGNVVGFRGSMNETLLGLAPDGNLESVDVFPSWCSGRDAERVAAAEARFERLWADDVDGVRVRPLPRDVEELLRVVDHAEDCDAALVRIVNSIRPRDARRHGVRTLRHHQTEVLEDWRRHERRGLAVMATGAGKTAIGVEAIRDAAQAGLNALVTVPSSLLLSQWAAELAEWLPDARVIRCGDGERGWARPGFLRRWLDGDEASRVAIATLHTASSDAFRSALGDAPRVLFVADEAHRLGSPVFRRLLEVDAAARLGLSATPERFGDAGGTAAVLDFFSPVLEPRYGLTEAIRDGVLTPYAYHPHVVSLTDQEQEAWDAYSARIARRVAAASDGVEDEGARRLLIERSRIAKRATAKIDLASEVLERDVGPGERWLVYCDDRAQLAAVREAATRAGIRTTEYHSAMEGDRVATLDDLAASPGVLVSIRCLDEGVDLPAVTHALILASSRNPREFIQRRGRILRRHPGKVRAHLHDAIVVPSATATRPDRLLLAELARAVEFAREAVNPEAAIDLEIICARFGVDPTSLASTGEENDVDAD
jgi:superfamily II DNA or RNA helicase